MEILKNKVGVITGAAGLMGKQHINSILKNGGSVVAIDIDKVKLNSLKQKYKKVNSKKILFLNGDVTKESSVKNSLKKIKSKFNRLDILINNAAIDYPPKKNINKKYHFENFDIKLLKKDLDVSLIGSLICTKIFGSYMANKNGGVILNISSDLGIISPDNRIYNDNDKKLNFVKPVTYSISKHGIIGLSKYTATYWAKKNIRCNTLAPGGIYNNQNKKSTI